MAKALSSGYLPHRRLMVGDRVAEVLIDRAASSPTASPIRRTRCACAVALANLRDHPRERIVEHVRDELAPYCGARWRELAAHPLVGEARRLGLLRRASSWCTRKQPTARSFEPRGKVGERCRDDLPSRNGLVMRAVARHHDHRAAAGHHRAPKSTNCCRKSGAIARRDCWLSCDATAGSERASHPPGRCYISAGRHRRGARRRWRPRMNTTFRNLVLPLAAAATAGRLRQQAAAGQRRRRGAAPAAGACGDAPAAAPVDNGEEKVLNVYNWSDYIDPTVIEDFQNETGIKVNYDVFDSNEVLETKLLAGSTGYDIVVPSASFLERQIKAGVFQKLDKSQAAEPQEPGSRDHASASHSHDPGNEHSVNYLWGTSGVGYNEAKIKAAHARRAGRQLRDVLRPEGGVEVQGLRRHACSMRPVRSRRHRADLPGQGCQQREARGPGGRREGADGDPPLHQVHQFLEVHRGPGQRRDLPGAGLVRRRAAGPRPRRRGRQGHRRSST